jgi:hypothetical protein
MLQDPSVRLTDLFVGQLVITGLVASVVPGAQQTSPPSLLVILVIVNRPEPEELPGY